MRRTLAFVAVLIVLGAASAVGVAWLGAGFGSVSYFGQPLLEWEQIQGGGRSWRYRSWNRSATVTAISQSENSPLVRSGSNGSAASAFDALSPWDYPPQGRTEVEFGWPFATLRSVVHSHDTLYLDPADRIVSGVLIKSHDINIDSAPVALGPRPRKVRPDSANMALPTSVCVPGAILSSLAWALIWSPLLLTIPLASGLLDRRRRRRGLCIKCGHALGPRSKVNQREPVRCAECGAAMRETRPIVSRRMVICATIAMALVLLADAALAMLLVTGRHEPPELHRAAGSGDIEWIQRQLASGTRVDIIDQIAEPMLMVNHATPLMWAAAKAQEEAALVLLAAGADPNASDAYGVPVLAHAAAGGSAEIIEALLLAGADLSADLQQRDARAGEYAFSVAAAAGHVGAAEVLLNAGALSVPGGLRSDHHVVALIPAARGPNAELMSRVLANLARSGFDQDSIHHAAEQWGIMRIAAARGRTETVCILLRAGVDPDSERDRPISAAIRGGWKETMLELIAAGASVTCEQGSLISEAILAGRPELVAPLIDAGADLDCWDNGTRPVLTALHSNDLDSAERLVRAGAAVEWPLQDGSVMTLMRSLHSASGLSGRGVRLTGSMVEFALRFSSDIDVREDGMTLLLRTAAAGNIESVRVLLEHGADPFVVDQSGRSTQAVVEEWLRELTVSGQQTSDQFATWRSILDTIRTRARRQESAR